MKSKLYTKDEIVKKLKKKYKRNVCIVPTKGYDLTTPPSFGNENVSRCEWADEVFHKLSPRKNRSEIKPEKPYNFAYVIFATDDAGNVYGLASGSSSFHKEWASNVFFCEKSKAVERMKEDALHWDTKEILIIKGSTLTRKKAKKCACKIKELFCLSDILYTKDEIVKELKKKYKENVCIVPTWINENISPEDRANKIFCELYPRKNRCEIEQAKPYNFAYVRFATDASNVYGIVGGKSSFHEKNESDVTNFYDLETSETDASKRMKKDSLQWYKEEILIVKNEDVLSSAEARDHEREIQEMFNLSD